MKGYTLVIFDLDGTLLDTTEGILASVQHTIRKLALPQLPREALLTFIGPPIQDSLAHCYGLEGEALQNAANLFRADYSQRNLLKAHPYEGIFDLFETLAARGIQTAVATYKREDYARELLCHFGFDRYTQNMYGADSRNQLRKSDIILRCLSHAGLDDLSGAVMIGDTIHDAKGAAGVGLDFIAVTYGFGYKRGDAACEGMPCAHTPLEILNFIEPRLSRS